MLVLSITLPKHESVTKKNNLAVDIFYDDVERFGGAMGLLIPAEIRNDREVNAEECSRNGLDLSLKPLNKKNMSVQVVG